MREKQKEEKATLLGSMARLSVEDSRRWFGDNPCVYSISHHTLSMVAEVGALANTVKKIERGDLDPKDAKVRMQLATQLTNSFIYMLNISGLMNFDLEKLFSMVRAENEIKFSADRAKREAKK